MAKWNDYQLMTTVAGKIGGPRVLILAIAAGGALVYKGGEVGVKAVVRTTRSIKQALHVHAQAAAMSRIYRVAEDADAGGGLTLRTGDEFRVLARDDTAILIEVVGSTKNPWYVSRDLLAAISDFTIDGDRP
ncbi:MULTISPECIES: hypothetical protein [Micromonospora]|uniref:Uncharacterized protein n=1 Tax=Micromonospora maris TaxID=1003110 RepID=A0A9X0HZ61_9ACTN|nr:hypothetical protein [Micromonospora maris]AEB44304.1 hypothetical protein VAB18032_15970 [Micromonospora maris AB-18-032]KUJ43847.1 hypothetical protein ADL17_11300 [Micromonospora maris]